MNKDKRNNIQLLGTLNNADESGIIANANQIYDANEDKSTQDVSKEHTERIETLETKENSMQTTLENISKTGEASAASNVTYNHNDSQLDATNVQQAIDEVRKKSNYNDGENIIDFNTIHLITDNPEYICVAVDADEKILYGIKTDGQPYFGVGCPQQVKDYIDEQINKILGTNDITTTIDSLKEIEAFLKDFTNSDTLKKLLDLKANVDEVRTTTDDIYKKSNPNDREGNVIDTNTIISFEDNPEYIKAITDSIGRLIEAIGLDGVRKFFAGINIQGVGQYVTDNPEYIVAWLDSQDRIIFAIENDGNPYFGYGVPKQINEFVEQKIAELSLDEYEDIVAFLNGLEEGDNTLQNLLDEKVDKEEGKSLIDEEHASTKSTIDNPEFLDVTTDNEGKVLEGIQEDGTKVIGGDLNVGGSASIGGGIRVLGSMEVSGVSYKIITNPEYLAAWVDAENKVIFGLKADGKTYVGDADFLDDVESIKAFLANFNNKNIDWDALTSITATENPEYIEAKTDSEGKLLAGRTPDGVAFENVGFSTPKVSIDGHIVENVEDPEGRSEFTADSEGKIISYRKKDGTLVENGGVETPSLKVTKSIELTGKARTHITSDIKASLNMPYMTKKFNLPDYGSINIICELFYLGTDNKEYNPTKVTKVNDIWYVTKTLTELIDPETGEKSYEVNENSIATTYTEIDVDMEDTTRWPVDKTKHYCKVAMKFGDINGIWYATVAFQGSSTLTLPKKGLRITTYKKSDFAKKDKIKIGEMITTSKFNVKAYYGDPTRLRDVVLQRLIIEARSLRDYSEQYPWNNDYPIFTEAVGTIQSFPIKLTTSGNFYGVSMMGLAKDANNFMLDGDDTGMLISGDYAGPQYPLSFAEFHPETWTDEMNDVKEGEHTQSNLAALTAFWDWINNGEWNKTTVPQHLSVIDWIDYYIFVQVFRMRDNDIHNIILYTKADKVKFYAFLYDLDLSFGRGYENTVMPIESPQLILWKNFVSLYWDEIVYRYKELRSSVLNYNHVVNLVTSIQACIPYSDFKEEMDKWSDVTYTDATKNMLDSFNKSINMFDSFFS